MLSQPGQTSSVHERFLEFYDAKGLGEAHTHQKFLSLDIVQLRIGCHVATAPCAEPPFRELKQLPAMALVAQM